MKHTGESLLPKHYLSKLFVKRFWRGSQNLARVGNYDICLMGHIIFVTRAPITECSDFPITKLMLTPPSSQFQMKRKKMNLASFRKILACRLKS